MYKHTWAAQKDRGTHIMQRDFLNVRLWSGRQAVGFSGFIRNDGLSEVKAIAPRPPLPLWGGSSLDAAAAAAAAPWALLY